MSTIKICSYNVRGINGDTKRRDVLEYLKKMNTNIYCIQDIHCGKQQTNNFESDWEGEMIISSGTSNSRGVAILLSKNFEYNIIETKSDPNGNYIALKIRMLQSEFSLINIYGPNVDDSNLYFAIINVLEQFQCATIILCGDWNTVQNQNLDTKYYVRENNTRCREKVASIKEEFELVDPWRNNNPNKKQYTWFQRNPVKMARLDYFLVSSDIMALTSRVEIKPGYRSDHSIVILDIKSTEEARGRGFWKLNTSLLHDIKYVNLIKEVIRENIQRYAKPEIDIDNQEVEFNINDQLFFETLKMEIRKSTIYYSSKKKRELEKQEKTLQEQIENIMSISNLTGENLDQHKTLENELEGIRCKKIKGKI
jgi:exonuclease III